MSLSSAAGIARSGLNAVAAETSVVSRNITGDSDTATYSRKIANVVTTAAGAQVASLTRASNRAVYEEVLSSTAAAATQDAIAAGLDSLRQTVGDISSNAASISNGGSPAALLSAFANALQSYEAAPSDFHRAAAAVAAAKTLSGGLNSASALVQRARAEADIDIDASVKIVNSLLARLEGVNRQIVEGSAAGADTTDAQDQRDDILKQLSQQIGVVTTAGQNNDISIYTDSGVTLFQGGAARSVTFTASNTYTAARMGHAIYIDGAPVTGSSAPMAIATGALAGFAALRDDLAATYQAQLDGVARALIDSFAESDQVGSGPDLPGLFSTPGATALPAGTTGLGADIIINQSVDPSQGGNAELLRDGGISDTMNADYTYNTVGAASFSDRLSQLLGDLAATRSFAPAGGITTSAGLGEYASASVGWLEAERSRVASEGAFRNAQLSTATTALSNSTGVNLDYEMSKLLDLEQSYAASAKLITAIDAMFHALLTDIGNIPA